MFLISSFFLNDKLNTPRRSVFKSQWTAWPILFSSMMLSATSQAANISATVGSGDNFWSTASGTVDTVRVGGANSFNNYAFRWNIAPAGISSPHACGASPQAYIAQNIGPVSGGIKIAEGVILHFTAGNLSNTLRATKNAGPLTSLTATANLTANGTMANLNGVSVAGFQQILCASLPGNELYNTPVGSPTKSQLTAGSLSIYVDDTARPGTYTVPALLLVVDISGGTSTQIAAGGTITVTAKASCTINMPAVVNFGTVLPGTSIVTKDGQIGVQCQNGLAASNSVNYRATPTTLAPGATTHIPLLNQSSKSEVGTIRGFLGANGVTEAGCNDASSSMYMDGSSHFLTSVSKNGSSNVPVTWTLCPIPNSEPGLATAGLAIEIDW